MIQLAVAQGARVIGVTSAAEKAKAAYDAGADEVILYSDDWVQRVKSATSGRGCDVAYDSVGSTLAASLAATKQTGTVVFFGMAGGNPAAVDPRSLMDASQALVGGDLWSYLTDANQRRTRASELFAMVMNGSLHVRIDSRYALTDAAAAHYHLESRKSRGKVLLIP